MKMPALLPLSLALSLTACATTGSTAPLLAEGPARLGQTVRVDGPTVRAIAVVEDSRCPAGVMCVWAGRVIVRAEVGTGSGKREMLLTLGVPVRVADGTLTLSDVSPERHPTTPITPGAYRFTFEFTGGL